MSRTSALAQTKDISAVFMSCSNLLAGSGVLGVLGGDTISPFSFFFLLLSCSCWSASSEDKSSRSSAVMPIVSSLMMSSGSSFGVSPCSGVGSFMNSFLVSFFGVDTTSLSPPSGFTSSPEVERLGDPLMVSEHSASDPNISARTLCPLLLWRFFCSGDSPEEDCPFEPFAFFFFGDIARKRALHLLLCTKR